MSSNTLSFDPAEWDLDDLWDHYLDEGLDGVRHAIQSQYFHYADDPELAFPYALDELDVIVQEAHTYFRDIEEAEIRHSEDMIERGLR